MLSFPHIFNPIDFSLTRLHNYQIAKRPRVNTVSRVEGNGDMVTVTAISTLTYTIPTQHNTQDAATLSTTPPNRGNITTGLARYSIAFHASIVYLTFSYLLTARSFSSSFPPFLISRLFPAFLPPLLPLTRCTTRPQALLSLLSHPSLRTSLLHSPSLTSLPLLFLFLLLLWLGGINGVSEGMI